MENITLDSLRLKFLKIISIINIVFSTLFIINFQFIHPIHRPTIHPYLLVISILTLWAIKKFPLNKNIIKFNAFSMVIIYAFLHYHVLKVSGKILPYPLFLFPLFSSFLLGSTSGLILSVINILIPIAIANFDLTIFGNEYRAFISIYVVEIVSIFFFERVNNYLLYHIKKAANTDALTGLENTSGFMNNLSIATTKKDSFYLILTDFDYFSRINSNLGYSTCDKILKRGGEILSDSDKILNIARYYGDQYAIIFNGAKESVVEYLEQKAKEIRKISDEINIDIAITISSGIINYPGDCDSVENLMSNVEIALKEAKKADRETYHFFDIDTIEEQKIEKIISMDLHNAIINNELQVHYQPKVNLHKNRVTGMEALVRWHHPQLGNIPPTKFIKVAEEAGLIIEVGDFVIEQSLNHLSRCIQKGYKDITVSINVSPMQLLAKNFIEKLKEKVDTYNVPTEYIYLEITENLMLESSVKNHLEKIKQDGFKLSLDDFGTGYSSLNYLREFQFDELKIDKSFTDGLLKSTKDIQMFGTILSIAKIYGMKTVVEGVELKEQLEIIQKLNINEIQGWYFSKALSSNQFMNYIQHHRKE